MALYEIKRERYPGSGSLPPGTVFVDQIEESGVIWRVYKGDSNSISAGEQERIDSGWVAARQAEEAEHQRIGKENAARAAREIAAWEASRIPTGITRDPGPSIQEPPEWVERGTAALNGGSKLPGERAMAGFDAGGLTAYSTAYPSLITDIVGAIGGAATGFLTGGVPGAIIGGTVGATGGFSGKQEGYNPGYSSYTPYAAQPSCPQGYYVTADGRCAQGGAGGTVARIIPGGNTGYLPTGQVGTPVPGVTGTVQRFLPGGQTGYVQMTPAAGQYGVGALPAQVSQMRLLCPTGMILGKDSLCYNRGQLRRGERKWTPERRPLLSANDGRILEKAHSLEHKLNTVAGRFLAPARPTARKKGRGRARGKR